MVSVFTKTGTFKRGLGSTFSRGFREQRGLLPVNEPALELFIFIRSCRSLIFQIFPEGELCPCPQHTFRDQGFPSSVYSWPYSCKELLLVSAQEVLQLIIFFYSWSQYKVTEGKFPLCCHGNSALLLLVKSSQSGEELAKIQYHTELL